MKKNVFLMISVLLFTPACFADEVIFLNGDRLTGTVKQLTEDTLVFESEVAGEVSIPTSKILTLSTQEPVEVHLKDDSVLKRKIEKSQSGQVRVAGEGMVQEQNIALENIAAINPPAPAKPQWKGDISIGYTRTTGNTETESQSVSGQMSRRGEDDRIRLNADYIRSEQEDQNTGQDEVIENWWRVGGKYDYFFTEKFYGFAETRYEKDSIANLDRRIVVGAGGGYQWVESDEMNFSTELGLASLYEKYETQTDSNTELSGQASYHFDMQINDTLHLIHDLTYYPSLEQFSDYYLTTTGELRASITENFFTNFKVILDYDASPAAGSEKTDTKYILGVGWNF